MTLEKKPRRSTAALVAVMLLAVPALAPVCAQDLTSVPGYVDGSDFVEMLGEDAVTVEISLSGPILAALTAFDPELKKLAGGLKSIHAMVLSPEGSADELVSFVRKRSGQLKRRGWQSIATVQESGGTVNVMVLSDGEMIQGLLVMVVDSAEGEVVFANIAGSLDLAAIAAIGEGLGVPGFDVLDELEMEDAQDE